MNYESSWAQNQWHMGCAPHHRGVVGALFPAEEFQLCKNVSGEYLGLRTDLHYRYVNKQSAHLDGNVTVTLLIEEKEEI